MSETDYEDSQEIFLSAKDGKHFVLVGEECGGCKLM